MYFSNTRIFYICIHVYSYILYLVNKIGLAWTYLHFGMCLIWIDLLQRIPDSKPSNDPRPPNPSRNAYFARVYIRFRCRFDTYFRNQSLLAPNTEPLIPTPRLPPPNAGPPNLALAPTARSRSVWNERATASRRISPMRPCGVGTTFTVNTARHNNTAAIYS